VCNSQLTFSTSKYGISQQGRGKRTEALSSLPFEKGSNEGGSAFFITVWYHLPWGNFFLIYQNQIELQ